MPSTPRDSYGIKGTNGSRGGHGRKGAGRLGRGERGLGAQETNLVTGRPNLGEEDEGDFTTQGTLQRPDYAFSVEQLNDCNEGEGSFFGNAGHWRCPSCKIMG